ncbi:MAG: Gfo/Idh/MocA family oxidoreductase, partial [Planctomycetaceae bacterium]|nr:Gfo/Idh/MocA family oxidoreductase [Planctomycetaceae bacterium]
AGAMHARSYRAVHGLDCRLKTVCALDADLPAFAERYGFASAISRYADLLADPAIDVVDIVTPPALHAEMVEAALAAGKHVICEKPLTGCFASGVDPEKQLALVMAACDRIGAAAAASGKRLCYAENWIYSPPFRRLLDLLAVKKSRVILIEGATGHSGSHAPHANYWKDNGGGALIRQGTHPVAAALHAKRLDAERHGRDFGIASVWCSCARLTSLLDTPRHLAARPVDVEDWARLVVAFADGARADIMAGDMLLGGIVNTLTVHADDACHRCQMTPNNLLESYFADADRLDTVQVMEKASHNGGWMQPLVRRNICAATKARCRTLWNASPTTASRCRGSGLRRTFWRSSTPPTGRRRRAGRSTCADCKGKSE